MANNLIFILLAIGFTIFIVFRIALLKRLRTIDFDKKTIGKVVGTTDKPICFNNKQYKNRGLKPVGKVNKDKQKHGLYRLYEYTVNKEKYIKADTKDTGFINANSLVGRKVVVWYDSSRPIDSIIVYGRYTKVVMYAGVITGIMLMITSFVCYMATI